MPLPRTGTLCLAIILHAGPGQAENIWSRTVTPTGPASYAPAEPAGSRAPAPEPELEAARPLLLARAPDFNRWSPGSSARAGGLRFFFGSGGFGFGRPGSGFSFGF